MNFSVSDTGILGKRKSESTLSDLPIISSDALTTELQETRGSSAIKLGSCEKQPAYY